MRHHFSIFEVVESLISKIWINDINNSFSDIRKTNYWFQNIILILWYQEWDFMISEYDVLLSKIWISQIILETKNSIFSVQKYFWVTETNFLKSENTLKNTKTMPRTRLPKQLSSCMMMEFERYYLVLVYNGMCWRHCVLCICCIIGNRFVYMP